MSLSVFLMFVLTWGLVMFLFILSTHLNAEVVREVVKPARTKLDDIETVLQNWRARPVLKQQTETKVANYDDFLKLLENSDRPEALVSRGGSSGGTSVATKIICNPGSDFAGLQVGLDELAKVFPNFSIDIYLSEDREFPPLVRRTWRLGGSSQAASGLGEGRGLASSGRQLARGRGESRGQGEP